MPNEKERQQTVLRVIGVSLLFGGVALVTYIVAGVSLRRALILLVIFPVLAFGAAWRRTASKRRAKLIGQLRIGLSAGVMATVAYDLTRFTLWRLNSSSYNPFEVIRATGLLLVGSSSIMPLVYGAGTAFHVLNGICFGMAYWSLFGRYGIPAAVGWGLFLEVFQLTLYPGWLNIRFYQEFVQISMASHLMYGLVLGLSCKWLWARLQQE